VRPYLKQLSRICWHAYNWGTGMLPPYYPAHNLTEEMVKGEFLENAALVGQSGPFPQVPAGRFAEFGFSTYLSGSGTRGRDPFDMELWRGVGFQPIFGTAIDFLEHINGAANTTAFHNADLVAGGLIIPVDFQYWIDLYLQGASSCVGNAVISLRHNALAEVAWTWTGLYGGVQEGAALLRPNTSGVNGAGLPDWKPLACGNLTVTVGGMGTGTETVTSEVQEIVIDLRNEIAKRGALGETYHYVEPVITRTNPQCTLLLEADVARYDFWQAAAGEDYVVVTATLGTGHGSTITITFTGKAEAYPTVEVQDGKLMQRVILSEHPDYPMSLYYS